MEFNEFNELVRSMFKRVFIENPTIHSNQICAVTLGENASPQFKKFLDGCDFGHKPLNKLVTNLDAELLIVVLQKDDVHYEEMKDQIREYNEVFAETTYQKVVEFHGSSTNVRSAPRSAGIKAILDQTAQDLLSEVLGDIPED